MNKSQYVGMDVHESSTSIAVLDESGKLCLERIIETRVDALREFFRGLSGTVQVTWEEGTLAAWLYDVIRPLPGGKPWVAGVVVCDPRQNKLLAVGHKGDRMDAQKLAHLLRAGLLKAVYHGETGTRTLKELAHSYEGLVSDTTRVMNRIKALYRGRGIRAAGRDVYSARHRVQWLEQLGEVGVRRRAETLYQELDALMRLRREAKQAMLQEGRRHGAWKRLRQVPTLGPIRVAQMIASVATPHRFRTKRQFWAYCGLAVVTRRSAEYQFVEGQARRRERVVGTCGLNRNYNRHLKQVFKSAAVDSLRHEVFRAKYDELIGKGMRAEMARLTLARKIAAISLVVWKKGERYDEGKLKAA